MNTKSINIAIDGPAGAGKSTLSRRAAQTLGYVYVDTGALYRAIGLFISRSGADPSQEQSVAALLKDIQINLTYRNGAQHVIMCGEDVSQLIRTPEISHYASLVSALPAVRSFLLALQRDIAAKNNVVMDGRDIGTVVLPEAQIKIFLTADVRDRARRRYDELVARGAKDTYEEVLADMLERDRRDTGRAVSPLRRADDAYLLDTTANTFEESFNALIALIKERLEHVL